MGADILSQLCTWVDAAYGAHSDLNIHTGGCLFLDMGWYIAIPASRKRTQKVQPGTK